MKMIIDIGEKEYENVLKFTDCYAFGYAIANGKPLQEELEEIKAEIKALNVCDKYDAIEIIDNHINNLK